VDIQTIKSHLLPLSPRGTRSGEESPHAAKTRPLPQQEGIENALLDPPLSSPVWGHRVREYRRLSSRGQLPAEFNAVDSGSGWFPAIVSNCEQAHSEKALILAVESGPGFCRFPGLDSTEAERPSGESRFPFPVRDFLRNLSPDMR
jgi:hypothetical protein